MPMRRILWVKTLLHNLGLHGGGDRTRSVAEGGVVQTWGRINHALGSYAGHRSVAVCMRGRGKGRLRQIMATLQLVNVGKTSLGHRRYGKGPRDTDLVWR